VSVRELSWGEWLQSLSHEIDAAKAIVVTLGTAATAALGWFGASLSRRRKELHTNPARRLKHGR
jgi:hypothetical protein